MNLFEMIRQGEISFFSAFIVIEMVVVSIICFMLAKDKQRNLVVASVLGIIPIVNVLICFYYIGVSKKIMLANK
ncbi:hypothetical protein [Thalassotalea sp. PLHSN55]|uniref:hypothetical protein n=1 Tax=Thalassotalea sp. PLHSN55 TaxID=3435888 RepID=UPI003F82C158